MKDFLKTFLASLAALFVYGIATSFIVFAMFFSGIIGLIGNSNAGPAMPKSAVLTMDMSAVSLSEQTREADIMDILQGGSTEQLGIFDAVSAINSAAFDPAVKYIYLKPDAAVAGTAQLEELRKALQNFRATGKAVVSYIENPTNAGYYLASVSDKIYMTPHQGGPKHTSPPLALVVYMMFWWLRFGFD